MPASIVANKRGPSYGLNTLASSLRCELKVPGAQEKIRRRISASQQH